MSALPAICKSHEEQEFRSGLAFPRGVSGAHPSSGCRIAGPWQGRKGGPPFRGRRVSDYPPIMGLGLREGKPEENEEVPNFPPH